LPVKLAGTSAILRSGVEDVDDDVNKSD